MLKLFSSVHSVQIDSLLKNDDENKCSNWFTVEKWEWK